MVTTTVGALNHFTLNCCPEDLPLLKEFYSVRLGLVDGPRPDFTFPGHWLYSDGKPIVHLAGQLLKPSEKTTGPLDHISFTGLDLQGTRQRLCDAKIPFNEVPVPGWPLYQIFLTDPCGLKIELTFDVATAGRQT